MGVGGRDKVRCMHALKAPKKPFANEARHGRLTASAKGVRNPRTYHSRRWARIASPGHADLEP
jgi:hypothetical protein